MVNKTKNTPQKGINVKNIILFFCSSIIINTAFGMEQPKEITIINKTSSSITVDFGWVFYKKQDRLDTYNSHIAPGKQRTFKLHTMYFADYPFIKTKSSTQSIQLPIPGENDLPFGETLTITKTNQTPTVTNQAGKTVGQLILKAKKRHK